ncbi:TY-Chap domain-containing protein [Actinomadura xylanilytica]|uniref:TY-Chap domain-containing protein n=1 Tax=Actinomadura xylanilytica TaxID=887459 RepID=UPI00255B094D|nr:hypothetical protein [Actinomadura xylanilytica]MDL4773661.1 hypothetical protein [Actinomadura xylanilytica]
MELESEEWPFFDVAWLVDPEIRADEEVIRRFDEDTSSGIGWYERRIGVWALHFEALRDAGIALPDLPHPFEPLFLLFERGSEISVNGAGFIEVDFLGMRRGRARDHLTREQLAPMEPELLDDLDWEYSLAQLAEVFAGLEDGSELTISLHEVKGKRRGVHFTWADGKLSTEIEAGNGSVDEALRSVENERRMVVVGGESSAVKHPGRQRITMIRPASSEEFRAMAEISVSVLRDGFRVSNTSSLYYRAWRQADGADIDLPDLGIFPEPVGSFRWQTE